MDKKDDKLKMNIDYYALNKITIKKNLLLHIDNMLDLFNGARYFNQIDFKLRYYYIHVTNEDVEKMVMRTKYDSYKFLLMPFGLCNVLSTFRPS
jgi:hypothetical protein